MNFSRSPPPWMLYVQGTLQKFRQGYPPLMRGVHEGGSQAWMGAWVGALYSVVQQDFVQGYPPRMLCVQGILKCYIQTPPSDERRA